MRQGFRRGRELPVAFDSSIRLPAVCIQPAYPVDGPRTCPEFTRVALQRLVVSSRVRDVEQRAVTIQSGARVKRQADMLQQEGVSDLLRVLLLACKRLVVEPIEWAECACGTLPFMADS